MQSRLSLPPSITIENIEALLGEIKCLGIGSEQNLTLDASAVENITTPGIQLLLSLDKTLTDSGSTFKIKNIGEAFAYPLQILGLQPQLTRWSELNA